MRFFSKLMMSMLAVLFSLAVSAEQPERFRLSTLPEGYNTRYGQQYWLYLPPDFETQADKSWPLVVSLHGRGEWGSPSRVKKVGLPGYIKEGHDLPAIVIAPVSPKEQYWHPLFVDAAIKHIGTQYKIDESRVYLTGLSMGGMGAWATALAYPHRFAALVPTAGAFINDMAYYGEGKEPAADEHWLAALKSIAHVPTWITHGENDDVVPTEFGKRTARLLEKAGGKPKLTLYPSVGHASWFPTYEHEELYKWLWAQRNPSPSSRFAGVKDATLKLSNQVGQIDDQGLLTLNASERSPLTEYIPLGGGRYMSSVLLLTERDAKGKLSALEIPGVGRWPLEP